MRNQTILEQAIKDREELAQLRIEVAALRASLADAQAALATYARQVQECADTLFEIGAGGKRN